MARSGLRNPFSDVRSLLGVFFLGIFGVAVDATGSGLALSGRNPLQARPGVQLLKSAVESAIVNSPNVAMRLALSKELISLSCKHPEVFRGVRSYLQDYYAVVDELLDHAVPADKNLTKIDVSTRALMGLRDLTQDENLCVRDGVRQSLSWLVSSVFRHIDRLITDDIVEIQNPAQDQVKGLVEEILMFPEGLQKFESWLASKSRQGSHELVQLSRWLELVSISNEKVDRLQFTDGTLYMPRGVLFAWLDEVIRAIDWEVRSGTLKTKLELCDVLETWVDVADGYLTEVEEGSGRSYGDRLEELEESVCVEPDEVPGETQAGVGADGGGDARGDEGALQPAVETNSASIDWDAEYFREQLDQNYDLGIDLNQSGATDVEGILVSEYYTLMAEIDAVGSNTRSAKDHYDRCQTLGHAVTRSKVIPFAQRAVLLSAVAVSEQSAAAKYRAAYLRAAAGGWRFLSSELLKNRDSSFAARAIYGKLILAQLLSRPADPSSGSSSPSASGFESINYAVRAPLRAISDHIIYQDQRRLEFNEVKDDPATSMIEGLGQGSDSDLKFQWPLRLLEENLGVCFSLGENNLEESKLIADVALRWPDALAEWMKVISAEQSRLTSFPLVWLGALKQALGK